MKPKDIIEYCKINLQDICVVESWGETGIFYNPNNKFKRGVYVLTIKEKDGDNDKASKLDRPNIYRLNIGVSKNTFLRLFADIPTRPPKGGVIDMSYDFTQMEVIMPHPVYGWMNWICILNPTVEYFNSSLKAFITEAYELAKQKAQKRK